MRYDDQTSLPAQPHVEANPTPRPAVESAAGPTGPAAPKPVPARRDLPTKVPFLAGFLSGIFPGVGQLYVGYYQQGIVLGLLFAAVVTILASGNVSPMEPFLGISLGFIWLYGIIDASRRAQAVNRYVEGFGEEPLPETAASLRGGSVFGGAVLVILGVIMLLHTRFDMDLQWLADWWPVVLVGLGAWLIWQARKDRNS